MKKIMILFLVAGVAVFASSCAKNTDSSLQTQEVLNEAELMPVEQVDQVQTEQAQNLEKSAPVVTGQAAVAAEKPGPKDIQQSLKNAGFYLGAIDGVIGPKSKKAIKDFQAQNNLSADGKVGPKTWGLLKPFLNMASQTAPASGIKD